MAGPRQIIDPPRGGNRLPYGLLSVADTPGDVGGPHWQNGVTYATSCVVTGGGFSTYDECIAVTGTGGPQPPAPAAKADNVSHPSLRAATPFTVYAQFDCAPVGQDAAEMTRLAEAALEQVTDWQVERAVWTGAAGGQNVVHPHLTSDTEVVLTESVPVLLDTAAVTVTGSGVKMTVALGLLEEALGRCIGAPGVIHVPRHAFPVLAGALGPVLESDGPDRLRTSGGNRIAVGTGYDGSSPAGVARTSPYQTWIYATGPVFALASAVRILGEGGQLDRAENTRRLIAERTHLVGWQCCHFAALVDLSA